MTRLFKRQVLCIVVSAIVFGGSSEYGFAQGPAKLPEIPMRFNVVPNARLFPQSSPPLALGSAIKAIDSGRYELLVAYLLDEQVVAEKIADRAATLAVEVENDLRQLRQLQKADPLSYSVEARLPDEPAAFAVRVKDAAVLRAYAKLVVDVRGKFTEDPTALKDLKRYLREGDVQIEGETAKITLKNAKGQGIFFKKVGERWFLEDRQVELKPAAAPGVPATPDK